MQSIRRLGGHGASCRPRFSSLALRYRPFGTGCHKIASSRANIASVQKRGSGPADRRLARIRFAPLGIARSRFAPPVFGADDARRRFSFPTHSREAGMRRKPVWVLDTLVPIALQSHRFRWFAKIMEIAVVVMRIVCSLRPAPEVSRGILLHGLPSLPFWYGIVWTSMPAVSGVGNGAGGHTSPDARANSCRNLSCRFSSASFLAFTASSNRW